jgi:hypothetical protein
LSKTHAPPRILPFTQILWFVLSFAVAGAFVVELLLAGVVAATLTTAVFSLIVLAAVAGSETVRGTFLDMITDDAGTGAFNPADRLVEVVLASVVAIRGLAVAFFEKVADVPRWQKVIGALLAACALCLLAAVAADARSSWS